MSGCHKPRICRFGWSTATQEHSQTETDAFLQRVKTWHKWHTQVNGSQHQFKLHTTCMKLATLTCTLLSQTRALLRCWVTLMHSVRTHVYSPFACSLGALWQSSPRSPEGAHLNRRQHRGSSSLHSTVCVSMSRPRYDGVILTFHVEVVAGDASHFNLPQVVLHTKLCEEGQRFKTRRTTSQTRRRCASWLSPSSTVG